MVYRQQRDHLYLDLDLAGLDDSMTRDILLSGVEAVRTTTKWLERALEGDTRRAVRGRLWRAWRSETYPEKLIPARHPTGEVFVNGGRRSFGAMTYWSQPGRVRGSRGQWLAIPSDMVRRERGRAISPREWEAENSQKLRYIKTKSGKALLIAEGVVNNRTGFYRRYTAARAANDRRMGREVRNLSSMIMYTLIPSAPFGNAFTIDPRLTEAQSRLEGNFDRAFARRIASGTSKFARVTGSARRRSAYRG